MNRELASYLLKHPCVGLKTLRPRCLKEYLTTLKNKGIRSSIAQLRSELASSAIVASQEELYMPPEERIEVPDTATETDVRLVVPKYEEPLISIIIPVFNNYNLTINCIESIIRTDEGIPFEIIIADDCSDDRTSEICDYVQNVRTARTEKNSRFLLNCNNAVDYARGKYVLFLNNDTQVREKWLSTLFDLAESDERIGLVGSKLLFPNGLLQEAGGILWSDGSAWNYGRGKDPHLPEFNYVKDVDYISGASIMVPRELFIKAGKFDEMFVPAYCEDSDLAFTLRSMGYRTVYQPFSEVYHFEGMSNGKITTSGLKQYQCINMSKFCEKWKRVLSSEHTESPNDLFHARDRSRGKKTILFIEESIPRYDDNAGARNIISYMRTLISMGANVKLMPSDFCYVPEYTEYLEFMGIEVLYGEHYMDKWKDWLKENGAFIDYTMLFRPGCAEKFLEPLKRYTNAKIFYNVADLHHVRMLKEYALTHDEKLRKDAEDMKSLETNILRKVDMCITLSADEHETIKRIIPEDRIRTYPIFCYDEPDSGARCYGGHDMLFVGSFRHRPNVDAMLWFLREIMPLIQEKDKTCKLHIVGSNVPNEIAAMASDNVILEGHVTDEALSVLYSDCAVCIIPLRFGAGVKGKTIEAMYEKIPIITTSTGIEGLPGIDDYIKPFDDPAAFADEVLRYISDTDAAEHDASRYAEYLNMNFSQRSLIKMFERDFQIKSKITEK